MQKLLKQAGFAEPHSSSTIGLVGFGVGLRLRWVWIGRWGWIGVGLGPETEI